MTKNKGIATVAFGSLSYGLLATVVKYANGLGAGTALLAFSQYFFAIMFLTILSFVIKKKYGSTSNYTAPSRKMKQKLILYGTTLGFSSCFYYLSIQYVPVSVGIILLMQSIWMGVVVDLISTKGKNFNIKIIGGVVAIAGTILAANLFETSIQLHPLGILFGLCAAISFTSFMFFSNRLGNRTHVIIKSKYLVIGGFVVVLLFWNVHIIETFDVYYMLVFGVFLAIFGSMVPPATFSIGMPVIGTGLGAIVSSIEIPFSVLSAAIILQEDVSVLQWIGIGIILCAVVLINFKKI
ncbi:EamA family transporter [Brumimicrobium salinarum]|uniref:EamA family transporter n=1 Tax=Brumimicrobium salinarum TaxID=2058658 RepID=A0A2I0R393_9FLAO|nr:EamA family transporter [Brumimicrobium salinarum]PKR81054.1 EamA family transporter [Brumimicrobium salinarum]